MIIQEEENSATYQIQRFEAGQIWINKIAYQQSVIIRPHTLLVPWPPNQISELTIEHFEPIFQLPPKILLLGTGLQCNIPADNLLEYFYAKRIGVEFMDSKAACYTYSVLAAEQREVAACILIR